MLRKNGFDPFPKVRVCRDFFNSPLPRDHYVINEWPPRPVENVLTTKGLQERKQLVSGTTVEK